MDAGPDGRLNVTNFGARGDGTTDDTEAIQRAIDAASAGDTVYFPAPEESYRIMPSGDEPIITVDGNRHSDDIVLKGDGEGTVIELTDDPGRSYAMIEVASPEDFSVTFKDLVLDGNRRNVDPSYTPGHGLRFRDTEATETGDMLVEDIEVRNANTSGINVQYGGIEFRRVTTHSNGGHGIGVSNARPGLETPPPLFKRCHAYNNGLGSFGTGIDFSAGTGIAEDVVIEDNEGNSATKVSVEASEFEYRRVRVENNSGLSFQNTGNNNEANVRFEDVIWSNNEGPIRLSDNATYSVPGGAMLVVAGNSTDSRGQIYLTDTAKLEADGDVYSAHTDGEPGLHSDTDSRGNYIKSYLYYGVGAPVRSARNLQIREMKQTKKDDIGTVPTADEVGAWS
jgi:hypothetical protein